MTPRTPITGEEVADVLPSGTQVRHISDGAGCILGSEPNHSKFASDGVLYRVSYRRFHDTMLRYQFRGEFVLIPAATAARQQGEGK